MEKGSLLRVNDQIKVSDKVEGRVCVCVHVKCDEGERKAQGGDLSNNQRS